MALAPILHQETRISPTPASASEVLHIPTTASRQAGRKRAFDEVAGADEESYARKHLATDGSVFFRRKARTPRSFLWRLLDDRKVLEIQCVDVVRSGKPEGTTRQLTFRLELGSEAVRNGVAFADPEESDAL